MLKGGIIMDVINAEQARIAEEAGACAVMALEKVPADIRKDGGVARMADPRKIKEIMATVTIPVMAKCRIGHFAEAQILQSLGVDFIDESEGQRIYNGALFTVVGTPYEVDVIIFNLYYNFGNYCTIVYLLYCQIAKPWVYCNTIESLSPFFRWCAF